MALAQNSYMAGSTSPSSFIQMACFFLSSGFIADSMEATDFWATESIATPSVAPPSVAIANVARNVKRKSKFAMIFISSMYKDLLYYVRFFCEKKHVLAKK